SPRPASRTSNRAPQPGQVSAAPSRAASASVDPHPAHASRYAYSVPRIAQTSTGTPATVTRTGRLVGGPRAGSGVQSASATGAGPGAGRAPVQPAGGSVPICSSGDGGGSVTPATCTPVTSGAA